MNEFLMFYAPFITLIGGLILSFAVVGNDRAVVREEKDEGTLKD